MDSGDRSPLTVESQLAACGPAPPRGSDHDLSKPSERLRARMDLNAPTTSSDQGRVNATRTSRGFGPGIARAAAQQGRTVVVACASLPGARERGAGAGRRFSVLLRPRQTDIEVSSTPIPLRAESETAPGAPALVQKEGPAPHPAHARNGRASGVRLMSRRLPHRPGEASARSPRVIPLPGCASAGRHAALASLPRCKPNRGHTCGASHLIPAVARRGDRLEGAGCFGRNPC